MIFDKIDLMIIIEETKTMIVLLVSSRKTLFAS